MKYNYIPALRSTTIIGDKKSCTYKFDSSHLGPFARPDWHPLDNPDSKLPPPLYKTIEIPVDQTPPPYGTYTFRDNPEFIAMVEEQVNKPRKMAKPPIRDNISFTPPEDMQTDYKKRPYWSLLGRPVGGRNFSFYTDTPEQQEAFIELSMLWMVEHRTGWSGTREIYLEGIIVYPLNWHTAAIEAPSPVGTFFEPFCYVKTE